MANDKDHKRSLMVRLSQRELLEQADLQAAAYQRYVQIEEQKKAANEEFKEQLDDQRKTMARHAHIVLTEEEPRMVLCRWIEDLDHNTKTLVRQDTGEVVEGPIAIPTEERQQSLLS